MAHKSSSYSGNRNASMTQVAGKYEINKSLFCDTTVGKLLFNQKDSITINLDTQVDKALELMVKFGISSLPVKDKDEKFQGILNMSDIVAHMSGCVSEDQSQHHMESKSKDVLKAPCSKLLNLSWESRHAAVLDANERIIVALAKIAAGGLRALVTGKGSWQVISEWQFAVWLATHCHEMDDPNLGDRREWLGSIVDCPIGELGLGESKDMETLSCELTAMEAFKKMVQLSVSSMPIVDANGMLCGTLSFSDLRGLDVSKLKLSINVMEFSSDLYQYPQVVADKETKFGDLLCRIQEREVDRVWLVGRDNKPFGVVSLTDIFQKLNLWLHLSPRLSSRTATQQVGSKASGSPASPPSAPARHAFSPTKMTEKEKLKDISSPPSSAATTQPSAPAAAPDQYDQALQQKLQQQGGGQQQQQQQQGYVRGQ